MKSQVKYTLILMGIIIVATYVIFVPEQQLKNRNTRDAHLHLTQLREQYKPDQADWEKEMIDQYLSEANLNYSDIGTTAEEIDSLMKICYGLEIIEYIEELKWAKEDVGYWEEKIRIRLKKGNWENIDDVGINISTDEYLSILRDAYTREAKIILYQLRKGESNNTDALQYAINKAGKSLKDFGTSKQEILSYNQYHIFD